MLVCEEGGVAAEDCQLIANWSIWGDWSICPTNSPIPMLNIRWRLRDCMPQPENCVEVSQYNCYGPYSEVVTSCDSGSSSTVETTTTVFRNLTVASSTTPLATTSTTTVAPPTTSVPTTNPPTTPEVFLACCSPLLLGSTQAAYADGVMTFVYNDNNCRATAQVTCSQPQGQGLDLQAAIIVNNINYIDFGPDSITVPATCVNGTWQMGEPSLIITDLECQLTDPA